MTNYLFSARVLTFVEEKTLMPFRVYGVKAARDRGEARIYSKKKKTSRGGGRGNRRRWVEPTEVGRSIWQMTREEEEEEGKFFRAHLISTGQIFFSCA